MNASTYYHYVKHNLLDFADPEIAEGQMKYMRNQFEYMGLKAPTLKAAMKPIFKEHGYLQGDELEEFVGLCMNDEYREMHYFGITMVEKVIKKQPAEFIHFIEQMLLTNSWWDTVDWINNFVGIHFKRYPQLRNPTTERWMDGDNFWLQRICIIFQLKYKNDVDFELMKKYILEVADSEEFFLQKAAGWALRQYSKFNPTDVLEFINNHRLSKLTEREGLRLMKKSGFV